MVSLVPGALSRILRPWVRDAAVVAFLLAMSVPLFFAHASRLSLSMDGFLLTYLMQTGDFQAYNIHEVKEPGRPFVGLGWHLASLLTGGTVTGYNAFMFACLLGSAVLVYFVVRTLLPREPVWALLAATFKIVWSANFEIFDNSGLAIYFAETLFWLALWLLVLLARERPSRFALAAASLVLAASLLVLVGTYQTPWPVVLLAPLALLASGVMPRRERYTYWLLALWYLASLPMMVWCYLLSRRFLGEVSLPLPELGNRLLAGIWASTGQALFRPFALVKGYQSAGTSPAVLLATAVFAGLLVWTGLQSWPAVRDTPRRRAASLLAIVGGVSLTVVVASLLPPLLKYPPTYGTRIVHWSSVGTVLGLVGLLAGLCRLHRWAGGALSAGIAVALVAGMAQHTLDIGNHLASDGFRNRRFWEDLSVEVSRVDEGTVVLMEGPARGIVTVDSFSTWVFRALTETHVSFLVADGKPRYDPEKGVYHVTSDIDLDQTEAVVPPRPHWYVREPKRLAQPGTFIVPADRVIWVKWDRRSRRLRVVPERSAMERLHGEVPSTFGQKLFPRESVERNRVRTHDAPSS